MVKLVLIRHGQSMWNLENKFTGWTDVDLSPKGVEEATEAGRTLKKDGYTFDVAYTSVLMRANKTEPRPSRCLEIAGVLGLTCDELLDPRIDVPETWRTDPENKFFPANSAARFWERRRELAELGPEEYYRRAMERSKKEAEEDMANMQ